MKKLNKLFLLAIILVFASCSKDEVSVAPVIPTTPATVITGSAFTAVLDENPTTNESLGTVNASSDGGDITYTITSQTPAGALTINNTTGEITTADLSAFDYEANAQVTANVALTADGVTANITATINVNDISDVIFTHTAVAESNSSNVTALDHPDLNGNPEAKIIITHYWNPTGTYNNQVTGVWYNVGTSKWNIFNEDFSVSIIEGSSYNILISKDGDFITHVTTNSSWISTIDNPATNNNPNANLVVSSYWNPNSVYNDNNLGVLYDAAINKWRVFDQDGTGLPANAAINISVKSDNALEIIHETTAANIAEDGLPQSTSIDHPSLNNNPNAKFVITHNRTLGNALDKTLGIYYSIDKWTVYTEDASTLPEGLRVNIKIIE